MNLQEQALIAAADDPVRAFTRLWTRKEAILKYYGTGIIDDLHSVLNNVPKNVKIDTFDHTDYVLSIAYTSNSATSRRVSNTSTSRCKVSSVNSLNRDASK